MSNDLGDALTRFAKEKTLADLTELAEFCQVVTATALIWMEAEMLPKGETLIRLQHYLRSSGYQVEELDQVPAPALKLGQAIAFGVVSVEEAARLLDYSNYTAVYRLVQGGGLSAERAEVMQLLIEQYEEETEARVAQFANRHASVALSLPSLGEPLSAVLLPSEILARGINQAVAMLDIVLELVDLNPEAAESLGDRVDTAKINATVERLLRKI